MKDFSQDINISNFINTQKIKTILLLGILVLAFFLRTYGINWDDNQHLHPDERFLTMVTLDTKWPDSFQKYLNPKISTLNPYNAKHEFYVYGTLPVTFIKYISDFFSFDTYPYNNITLVGRFVSALLDTGIVLLVFCLAKKAGGDKAGMLASFLYAVSVLPIQLSHFYAVDPFLTFFLVLNFLFLTKLSSRNFFYPIAIGISFGLALASKISAITFLPIILLAFTYQFFKNRKIFLVILFFIFLVSTYFAFRIGDPKTFASNNFLDFHLNPKFVANISQLASFNDPNSFFPPAVQWITTKPFIFPLKNLLFWGLGLPLGSVSVLSVLYYFLYFLRTRKMDIVRPFKFIQSITEGEYIILTSLAWILLLYFYQGMQFVKALRYFYPIYPFLAILTGNLLYQCFKSIGKYFGKSFSRVAISVSLFVFSFWTFCFLHIYSVPHTRVQASNWIYRNIPEGSTLTCEHWDDCLPLNLPNNASNTYEIKTLEMFNPDDDIKWRKIDNQLENSDYIILSSNRVWGSVSKVPERYPKTSNFYDELFNGHLQYIKVAEFTSYAKIPFLGISFVDDEADETFTVYDHPKVMIFRKL